MLPIEDHVVAEVEVRGLELSSFRPPMLGLRPGQLAKRLWWIDTFSPPSVAAKPCPASWAYREASLTRHHWTVIFLAWCQVLMPSSPLQLTEQ